MRRQHDLSDTNITHDRLHQLLHRNKSEMTKKVKVPEELLKAARRVARSVEEKSGKKKTESDLVKMLEAHETDVDAAKKGSPLSSLDLAKVLVGMKVDKSSSASKGHEDMTPPVRRGHREDTGYRSRPPPLKLMPRSQTNLQLSRRRINILGGERLGIFEQEKDYVSSRSILDTWKQLQAEELKFMVTHPPRNAFEEMIRWTEQGKMWKYPINNELGLEAEEQVPFHEHVFLDSWIKDVPRKSAIGQFLEIMCLSLSKNPYITVQRKKETFDWFLRYFKQHEDILIRTGALDSTETRQQTSVESS